MPVKKSVVHKPAPCKVKTLYDIILETKQKKDEKREEKEKKKNENKELSSDPIV